MLIDTAMLEALLRRENSIIAEEDIPLLMSVVKARHGDETTGISLAEQAVEAVADAMDGDIETLHESVDQTMNGCGVGTELDILRHFGDVDLGEPAPDLSSWTRARACLAFNALYAEVSRRFVLWG